MIDNRFRALLPKYVKPLISALSRSGLSPNQVSYLGLLLGLMAATFVANGLLIAALVMWWLSRLLDALDGIYARATGKTTEFGAFLDIQLDMLAYSAMIFGFFVHYPEFALQWILIMLCYVLCISGALGLGSFETKHGIDDGSGRGLKIASGLAEGGETGIAYTVFLLFPQHLSISTWVWIFVLLTTIVSRLMLANAELRDLS